jgi:hypothetical protein
MAVWSSRTCSHRPVEEAAEVTLIWVVGFVAICLLVAASSCSASPW